MLKTKSYHESAIVYNEKLAEFAEELSKKLVNEEVQRWCKAVGKQHRFHAKRHRAALERILDEQPPIKEDHDMEAGPKAPIVNEQKKFAESFETDEAV